VRRHRGPALISAERAPSGVDSRDVIVACAVVVTAGAWRPGAARPLGIELPVVLTRETVAYFDILGNRAATGDGQRRLWPASTRRRPGLINYALAAPGVGLKAGLHHAGPPADPDEPGVADPAVVRWVSAWAARRYPELDPEPIAAETCLYTNTADESFVLERHGRIVVASACSGHGFKFAPVLGRTLAALARDAARS
jgi:sarcosine oxidase